MELVSPTARFWGRKFVLFGKAREDGRSEPPNPTEDPEGTVPASPPRTAAQVVPTTPSGPCRVPQCPSSPPGMPPTPKRPTCGSPYQAPQLPPASSKPSPPPRAGEPQPGSIVEFFSKAASDPPTGAYIVDVLQPLLLPMVEEVLSSKPVDPAVFLLSWLFRRLVTRIPETVSQTYFRWVQQEKAMDEADDEGDGEKESSPSRSGEDESEEKEARENDQERTEFLEDYPLPANSPSFQEDVEVISIEEKQLEGLQPAVRKIFSEPTAGFLTPNSILKNRASSSMSNGRAGTKESTGSTGARLSPRIMSPVDTFGDLPKIPGTRPAELEISSAATGAAVAPAASTSVASDKARRGRRHTMNLQALPPERNLDEVAQQIMKVPIFSELSKAEAMTVAQALEIRFFEPDAEIVRWNQQGGDLHFIQSGKTSVSVPSQVQCLEHGSWFGEQTLMNRYISSQYRIAAVDGPVITLCLTSDKLHSIGIHQKLRRKRQSKVVGKGKKNWPPTPARKGKAMTPSGSLENAGLDGVKEKTALEMKLIVDAVRESAAIMDVLQLTEDQIQMIAQQVIPLTLPTHTRLHDPAAPEGADSLYIVQEGLLEVVQNGKVVNKYRNGQSFGEMGLLYGTPCRQVVRVATESRVWKLTQESFRHVLRAKPASRLKEYAEVCNATSIFAGVENVYLEVLAEALEEQFFVKGEDVVLVGQQVEMLYIVFDGTIVVGDDLCRGRKLHRASYFGLTQMSQRVRQQRRVHVASDTATLLTLDRNSLELLTGMTVPELAAMQCEASDEEMQSVRSVSKAAASKPRRSRAELAIPKERLSRLGLLGAGSFGLVTLEEDTATGHWYALKAVSKGYCAREGLQEMPLREKSLQLMLDSPFIIKLLSTYKDDQFLYFLLQPANGGELFELYNLHEEWFGQAQFAMFFFAGASLGLEHMHSRKIVYRDMKLENILMDERGYTLIADLGLAKVVPGKTHTLCGTADYMAPETLRRQGYNHAVDWWALGVMLFIMMSGGSPFDANEVSQIYRNIVKGFKKDMYPESFGKDLVEVIGGLCKKKPEERVPMGPKGLDHLKEMRWFTSFGWPELEQRSLPPPWVPAAKTAEDYARASLGVPSPPIVDYTDDGSQWYKDF